MFHTHNEYHFLISDLKFEVLSITKLSTLPAEDLDNPILRKPENQLRILTPLQQKYLYLTDSFDRGSIYAACQYAFARNIPVKNVHCFYFGFKGATGNIGGWQLSNRKVANRISLLEEMLFTAKIMNSLQSITLTTLSLVKRRLISKHHMKQLYKDPKDPQLDFNRHKQMIYPYNDQFGEAEKFLSQRQSEEILMDASLHDDLEAILSITKKFNGNKLEVDQKFIFHLPKLTSLQIAKLNRRDIEFSKTFKCFPYENFDVPVADMIESNSTSKFELWDGLRTTLTIPSDDYPLLTSYRDGHFILPLCEDFLYNPLLQCIEVEEDEDSIIIKSLVFDQDINFESNFISEDQIQCYIEMSLVRLYHQFNSNEKESQYLYLKKYEENVTAFKQKGEQCVYVRSEYAEECSFISGYSHLLHNHSEKFLTFIIPVYSK